MPSTNLDATTVSAAAVPVHPAPDFDSPLGLLRRDSSFKLPGLT